MPNTSAKGSELERWARYTLEERGYLVHRTVRTPVVRGGRVIGSNPCDIFGAYDLIALGQGMCRFIQVTTLGEVRKRQRKVAVATSQHMPAGDCVTSEVWAWVGGRGTRVLGGREVAAQSFRVTYLDGAEWVEAGALRACKRPVRDVGPAPDELEEGDAAP